MVLKASRRARHVLFRVDRAISALLDRVLTRNVTIRYLIGLGLIAFLAIAGQIQIQSQLTRQIVAQDQIRVLDSRISATENLKKAILALELSATPGEVKRHAAVVRPLANDLLAPLAPPEGDHPRRTAIESSQDELGRAYERFEKALAKGQRLASAAAPDVLKGVNNLQEQLLAVAVDLESRQRSQVSRFRRIELTLLTMTLLVLALEALYVFRPAVTSLYEALRVRSEFLARMSHEIRNPMNSILGMANLLAETRIDEQQKRYLSILRRSSVGLLGMLNQLLDFSSLESGKLTLETIEFSLYEVLERALDMAVVAAHASGIELVLDLGEDVPLSVRGDPSRLQQILTNLLGNAVKFTKSGEVVLEVRASAHADGPIEFAVVDTGMGIEARKLSTIFEAFVQEDSSVRRRFGGTGLGLSIARQLVELMSGQLSVRSAKDVGSRFSFRIPLPATSPRTLATSQRASPLPAFAVVLAETNPRVVGVLSRIIRAAGGTCVEAPLPNSDLDELLTSRDGQLVVLDYDSFKAKADALLTALAKRTFDPARLIVLLKTTAASSDLEMLGRLGVRNLLFKPVKPLQFRDALAVALAPHETISAEADAAHPHDFQGAPGGPTAGPLPLSTELRILVADDSPDNQNLMTIYLTPARIVLSDDGQAALQRFKEGRFDLVLMDLQMPVMDGYTATRRIREWERALRQRPVPIVAVSAHDSSHDAEKFRASGFTTHLVKPVDARALRATIHRLTALAPQPVAQEPLASQTAQADQDVLEIEAQIAKLAPAYLENRRKELGDLERFLSTSDFKGLRTVGHRLKGNAKSYGFAELADIGAALEKAALACEQAQSAELVRRMAEYLSKRS